MDNLLVTAGTALKAGGISAAIAVLSTDIELMMVLNVGIFGGVLFFFKEYTHLQIKTTKLKALAEFLVTVPMATSTAGVVYYLGTKGLNMYCDCGSIMWISLSLMASLHFRKVVGFFTILGKTILNKKADGK